jgi:hypothetical protein
MAIPAFWDTALCGRLKIDVSEELPAFSFRTEEYFNQEIMVT